MKQVCSDLKVTALRLALQGGFTNYCCFLCLWVSPNSGNQYLVKYWSKREEFAVGEKMKC
jgi:hypothetical protein